MRIKADLYSGNLFESWEPKKRDHQTLPIISHRNMKINTATGVSTRHKVTTMMSGDIVTKTKNIRVGTRPIPADGFYEWKKVLGGKIPYSISMKDGSPFVFAGLWAIITDQPNELAQIHTRMLVIEHHEAWLNKQARERSFSHLSCRREPKAQTRIAPSMLPKN